VIVHHVAILEMVSEDFGIVELKLFSLGPISDSLLCLFSCSLQRAVCRHHRHDIRRFLQTHDVERDSTERFSNRISVPNGLTLEVCLDAVTIDVFLPISSLFDNGGGKDTLLSQLN
jgi:hypothetical protein